MKSGFCLISKICEHIVSRKQNEIWIWSGFFDKKRLLK